MPALPRPSETQRYLKRRALGPRRISRAPSPRLGLVVVIPSRDEPELLRTLESLRDCARAPCDVEVLVVINASQSDGPAVHERNLASLRAARRWAAKAVDPGFVFRFLHYPSLPAAEAGVGLARKLGMDEAVARLDRVGADNGIVVCFDADCVCDSNYLQAIHSHFRSNAGTPGCSVYFEHPLEGPLDRRLYDGIASYELYLRYHVQGLRYASVPYAFHTVGSSMAVRASAYVAQGGMNQRQAGEDFYFLQKLFALGEFSELLTTRVLASARLSHRVPFGTGRAMQRWLENERQILYVDAPQVYRDLASFAQHVEGMHTADPHDPHLLSSLPKVLAQFLERYRFRQELARIQRHTASLATFRHQLYCWFNAFRALKFIHFATDTAYPKVPVRQAAATLLQWSGHGEHPQDMTARELLAVYRALDLAGGRIRSGSTVNSGSRILQRECIQ